MDQTGRTRRTGGSWRIYEAVPPKKGRDVVASFENNHCARANRAPSFERIAHLGSDADDIFGGNGVRVVGQLDLLRRRTPGHYPECESNG